MTIGFALLLLAGAGPAGAGDTPASDWPGLWGPHRDARVAGPLRAEPGMQLVEAWRRPLGKGYSEVAATAGRGYTMYSDGEVDHLLAFEVASGKEVWRARMAATYRGHGSDDGPISTPVIADGRVFALDPWGVLFAFDAAAGRELWRRDLKADLGAVPPFWGFATSPLPLGKTLVVQAGGAERNNLVALDPATGKEIWVAPIEGPGQPSLRGLEYWPGDKATPARLFFGTRDGRLIALDAATGQRVPGFGNDGVVALNTPEIIR
ncbi:MAG TPA: PQQ-binding-like beta-propeller repeat protein, partial [Thermoanaerobaculia bacterium]|nr:PQQ-binding-like beta-propeller repeat protein [Thermoanaerobaculia bacterium]